MEDLPKTAKTVMGIYATAVTLAESSMAFFTIRRDDMIVILAALLVASVAGSYVYIVLYFRHYKYHISDGVIIIKKGALFKRRHLVYVDKISYITIRESFVHRWFSLCTIIFYMQGRVVRLNFVPVDRSHKLQEILDSRH